MKNARLWVGVLGLVAALGTRASAGPEEKPKGPTRPAWLVGIWETTTPEGEAGLVLGADGTASVTLKTAQGEEGMPSGTWAVEDGTFVQHHGGEVIRYRIERPADEGGAPRLRIVEPGTESTAPTFRRRADVPAGLPRFMFGTWEDLDTKAPGAQRFVLKPSGRGHLTLHQGDELKEARLSWSMKDGRLALALGEKPLVEEVFLDVVGPGERLRITLSDAHVERTSWPPAQATYEGPLVGEWTLEGAPFEERIRFLPTGRYERRRHADLGTSIERGTFRASRGAQGDLVRLESSAGRVAESPVRFVDGRLTLRAQPAGQLVTFALSPGSPEVVARQAFDDAAAEADTRARYRFQVDRRGRVKPPSPAESDEHWFEDDPAPTDVHVGDEAFADLRHWVGESEQVLARSLKGNVAIDALAPGAREQAEPRSTRPHQRSEWMFAPDGRVRLEIETFGIDGTAGGRTAGERTDVHFGKYSITGDLITVQLQGQRERHLRLDEGGLFLLDVEEKAMLLIERIWRERPIERPADE